MKISPDEIAFDIDGVFADTFRVFIKMARNEYGYSFDYDDITEYDFLKVLNIDKQESDNIIQTILDYPIESGIGSINGAVKVLTKLSRISSIFFVTARPGKKEILNWICHQLPGVDENSIRLVATGAHEDKLPVLLENDIKYFVEDRLETCYLLKGVFITPIVFEQPWNRKPHNFRTVRTWDEISDIIKW